MYWSKAKSTQSESFVNLQYQAKNINIISGPARILSHKQHFHHAVFGSFWTWITTATVDGWNPAPPGMYETI